MGFVKKAKIDKGFPFMAFLRQKKINRGSRVMSGKSSRFSTLVAGSLCLILAGVAAGYPDMAEAKAKKPHAVKVRKKAPAKPARKTYDGGPKAMVVLNANTGEILYQDRSHERRQPASMTKMVTAMVVFDALRAGKLKLTDKLPLAGTKGLNGPVTLVKGTGGRVHPGSLLSVDTLLAATAVKSAADATNTLAEGVCGNVDCFVDLMNKKAAEILGGTKTTHFANPHGMPDPDQYSTAYDLAKIIQYMRNNYPEESRYFGMTSYEVNGKSYPGHNDLLVDYTCTNAVGLPYRCMMLSKTGWFLAAGSGGAYQAAGYGYEVTAVSLGNKSAAERDQKVRYYLDWAFKTLQASNAPKIKQHWHFPNFKNVPVEKEPMDFEDTPPEAKQEEYSASILPRSLFAQEEHGSFSAYSNPLTLKFP
jgi:D-alanyl-D-alanine carboxypeptidase